jgi:hypothetical protein
MVGSERFVSVLCKHSPAAMARRVFLSRSIKWRRDDEPLEPQAHCPSRIPSRTRVERGIHPNIAPLQPSRSRKPCWNALTRDLAIGGNQPRRVRVVADQSLTNRQIITRLWDVLDDPHLNQALGIPQNSRITFGPCPKRR